MSPNPRRRVALVGATGVAGQQFLVSLERHPWFELTTLAASARSAGKSYRTPSRTPRGQRQWFCEEPLPAAFARMPVVDSDTLDPSGIDLVFSAVESGAARALEERFAAHVPVISTSSAFRYEDDVPILVPGVNLEHAVLVKRQQRERGWKGFVAPIPNCTTTGLVIALAPLARRFGLRSVVMTSMQALSGAGRSPGVAGLDILDNVIPYIPNEEEKVERETRKILGRARGRADRAARDRGLRDLHPRQRSRRPHRGRDGRARAPGVARRGGRTPCAPSAGSSSIWACPRRRPS